MAKNIPEALIRALRKACEEHTDKMIRAGIELDARSYHSWSKASAKMNKLFTTLVNVNR